MVVRKIDKKRGFLNNNEVNCLNSSIKTSQMFSISTFSHVPCNWTCCSCMPLSSAGFVNGDLKAAGSINLLQLSQASCTGVRSLFSDIFFVLSRHANYSYKNVTCDVLQHSRIEKAISVASLASADEINTQYKIKTSKTDDLVQRLKQKSTHMFHNMAASFRVAILKLTGWLLYKVLRHTLTSLMVHKGQLYALQQTCKKKVPVLLLPTHKSHLDYIILSFILFNYDIKLPYVAAGDNLNIPIFQRLMRSYGGFFVRRTMDLCDNKDHIYRAILKTYVEEMMASNEMLEFFIEGGRCRSGKVLHPRTGLLAYVVEAYLQGRVEDIMVVPVSISYEKLIEGNFISEQLGKPKKSESFLGVLWNALKVACRAHGVARVDFAQAFSIQEFFSKPSTKTQGFIGNLPSFNLENSASSADLPACSERTMVNQLALHIAYEQSRNVSVSSTSLLSWILLYKTNRNKAVCCSELEVLFEQNVEALLFRGHFVNFSGSFQNILEHSIRMLQPHVEYDRRAGRVKMRAGLESCIYLAYHANSLCMVYALDALIALSVLKTYHCGLKHKLARISAARNYSVPKPSSVTDYKLASNTLNTSNSTAYITSTTTSITATITAPSTNINGVVETSLSKPTDVAVITNGNGTAEEVSMKEGAEVSNGGIPKDLDSNLIKCHLLRFDDNDGINYCDIVANKVKQKVNSQATVGTPRKLDQDAEDAADVGDDDGRGYLDDDLLIEVNLKDVERCAMQLIACLKYEFVFFPPCKRLDDVINDNFLRVADLHHLINQQDMRRDEEEDEGRRGRKINTDFMDLDDESVTREVDEIFLVPTTSLGSLKQQALLLQPLMHTYSILVSHLTCLLPSPRPEKEFVLKAQNDLKDRYRHGTLPFGESVCFETVTNFMKLLVDLEVTTSHKQEGIKMLGLSEKYSNQDTLLHFVSSFASFSSLL